MTATNRDICTRPLPATVYTGKTEMPCCLCDDPDTVARLDLPSRAMQLMEHSGPIVWPDIVGKVSIHFCESDWNLAASWCSISARTRSRVAMSLAPRSTSARIEALLNDVRAEPDHTDLERQVLWESQRIIETAERENTEERDVVEARIVQWTFEELGVEPLEA